MNIQDQSSFIKELGGAMVFETGKITISPQMNRIRTEIRLSVILSLK